MEKTLMNFKEFLQYTGWGATKARAILKRKDNNYTVYNGNRPTIIKDLFDAYLIKCATYQINL